MEWLRIIWDWEAEGNVEHIEENDLSVGEVDHVLRNRDAVGISRSSGRPCVFGYTPDGRYVVVVYEQVDDAIYPVTAYEIEEP